MKNRMIPLLAALVLLFALALEVCAHEVPDLETPGSITFLLTWDGEDLEGGSLSLYRVGDIREEDGNYFFTWIPELADLELSLEDPNDPALARALVDRIGELEPVTVTIEAGKAGFADVAPGLYLVYQHQATSGFEPMSPFLISMPRYEDGHYVTEITARPKATLETVPTEPEETEPTEPDMPQTGLTNWPVPVLAAGGLSLFALGWMLCFPRKKDPSEE